jgi:hypothetical protein
MAEATGDPPLEGWGVAVRPTVWIAAAFFGALIVFIAAVALFYRLSVAHQHEAGSSADPAGDLQTMQRRPDDRLPLPPSAPPAPTRAQAQAIANAMAALGGEGDEGWAPLAQAPPTEAPLSGVRGP